MLVSWLVTSNHPHALGDKRHVSIPSLLCCMSVSTDSLPPSCPRRRGTEAVGLSQGWHFLACYHFCVPAKLQVDNLKQPKVLAQVP